LKGRPERVVATGLLPVYEQYKHSCVLENDQVPTHWEEKPLKYVLKERKIKSVDGKGKLLMVSQTHGVVERAQFHEKAEIAESTIGHKKCNINDLIFNKLKAHLGVFFQTSLAGLVSPDYAVYYQVGQVNVKYLEYLFRHPAYISSFTKAAKGIVDGLKRLYTSDLFSIHCICPPALEQEAILRFIDHKTCLINHFIARKRRLIRLLQEQKSVIINQAVTRGIDPAVRLKQSGIDWLGDIPEHWEVKKLKYLTTKVGSGVTPRGGGTTYKNDGIPLLRSQNILFHKISLKDVAYISTTTHENMANSHVYAGDVLLNITGGSLGRCFYVDDELGEANVNQHVCIVRPNRKVSTQYLYYLLRAEIGQKQIWFSQTGSGREGLNFSSLKEFSFPIPPQHESKMILEWILENASTLDTAITKANQEITLIKEYRESLIAEAVTGKIDVRNWQEQKEKAA
jgi:type I restriction enzyme, S subunit